MKQRPDSAEPQPSQRRLARLLAAGSVAALLFAPALGRAQSDADVEPPPPNILLLVDSSGSMDYKLASTEFPTCAYSGVNTTGQASEKSRWIELVEVMTGSIHQYDCQKLDRNGTAFKTEYNTPYDFLYPNPYHRPMSNGCVAGPGTLAANPALFPTGAIKYHPYNDSNATCSFDQASDGVLDAFVEDVRFALMTFDTEPRSAQDVSGLWSYYPNGIKSGRPKDCTTDEEQEVGVRNYSAPPWEGRAIGFGNPAGGSTDYQARNSKIQEVLLATRPYGATPIAGMLDDARGYFLNEAGQDPLDTSFGFGPKDDPATCRKRSIILLSDGQPNMDLRPYCEPGNCPYDKAESIAQSLKNSGIDLFVIGFALSSVTVNGVPTSCSSFTDADFDELNPNGICAMNKDDAAIQACCSLNRIAAAGGHVPAYENDEDWRRAKFADNRDELRAALGKAIGANFAPTTRQPVVSASGAGFVGADPALLSFARAFRFGTSFEPAKLDQPWRGNITRSRYVCDDPTNSGTKTPRLLPAREEDGDFFAANVNKSGPDPRKLFTVVGDSPIQQVTTIRPNIGAAADGAGTYSGTQSEYTSTTFATTIPPAAASINGTTCQAQGLDANQCRDYYLKWLVGLDNGTVNNRCKDPSTGKCNLIGDIIHAAPRPVAGRPNELINDASYDKYAKAVIDAKRPSVLYVPSNDGFLHAFKILAATGEAGEAMKVKSLETNELWAFVPPATLSEVRSLYPGAHQLLLDGSPVVKDVVATADAGASTPYKFKLERSKVQAQTGEGTWRTILVQGFGPGKPGYFALDVTEPVVSGSSGGPQFLWQLMTDETGEALFGSGGATPLITTVFIGGNEVAVAVLPGGRSDEAGTTSCARGTTNYSSFVSGYLPRANIPCYTEEASIRARSLTVVRLDTGEILRTFRKDDAELPALTAKGVVTEAPIDSPLTGQPVAFPSEVGAVADRVFIGDQDGALWRLNFASASGSSADWTFELFFDAFPSDGSFGHDWNDGQPISTPPVISVDTQGRLSVAISTGNQNAIGSAPGLVNYVWSLIEKPNADRTKLTPEVKWHLDFKSNPYFGDRVIGAMALFSGDLYFTTMGPEPNSNDGACSVGVGKLWGMRYLDKHAGGEGKGGVMAESLKTLAAGGDYVSSATLVGSSTTTAFLAGVSVGQQPSCENPGSTSDEGYFASGTHNSLGRPAGGQFQLFVSTGSVRSTSSAAGITPVSQGGANSVAVDLRSPRVTTRVDSWAAIVE